DYQPAAVTLDIFLPDIEGWRVLDRLKNDIHSRHIPVCVISTDEARERSLNSGALAFIAKPIKTRETLDQLLGRLKEFVSRSPKELLVVEHDSSRRERMLQYLDAGDVQLNAVTDVKAALNVLRERKIDCVVLNPELPGLTPGLFAEELQHELVP